MANSRDFEVPLASFGVDETHWEIIYKRVLRRQRSNRDRQTGRIGGQLFSAVQDHTPFDVVTYVPYTYAMEKFTFVGSLSKDHIDPSVFTVLIAKSKATGIPLVDVLIFAERWNVASETLRPPVRNRILHLRQSLVNRYYHRNNAIEIVGVIFGEGGDRYIPGGIRLQTVFCPHRPPPEVHKAATVAELKLERITKDTVEVRMTDYAMNRARTVAEFEPLSPDFISHLDEINTDLEAAGYNELKKKFGRVTCLRDHGFSIIARQGEKS
ncbi:homogentisate 1,2-dioxygenase-domain-containing protein [Desarmillaria ectypa]|nr:homogentisate 1,2-dioxygenase-domain-containing protein [Desarmillaria ectypa]